jgi:fumarate hydratase class I
MGARGRAGRIVEALAIRGRKALSSQSAVPFQYQDVLEEAQPLCVPYKLLTTDHVQSSDVLGRSILHVDPEALRLLTATAMADISHLLRSSHLASLRAILDDPDASSNDRFVALELLKNANIAAGMQLPGCQDTGTAIVQAKRGMYVWTDGNDERHLSRGVYDTFRSAALRYSQVAPLDMFSEQNTKTNLPAQIEMGASSGSEYKLHFITKGGGSANKTFLFQETKALLSSKEKLLGWLKNTISSIGTGACPPYHLAIVIGGTSAEFNLKAVKLASARSLDGLHNSGNELGRGFRDQELEHEVHKLTRELGIGAQFGGKYFCHDVRVIRLPRHGASLPVGIGVSCSADRHAYGLINEEGVFVEQLEDEPSKYLPDMDEHTVAGEGVHIDLDEPMDKVLAELRKYQVTSRLSLSGTMVVARDAAHAKLKERLDRGEGLPEYIKQHPVYYAGPAKTPEGYASGSFGPTTAGRMDSYVRQFQENGGSMVMLAKGNRSPDVAKSCRDNGGFYLGSTGGPAAKLAHESIKNVEPLEFEELGMEAVWRIQVENFPAFIVIDAQGNDFYKQFRP